MERRKELVSMSIKALKPYSKNEKVHTNDNLELIKLSLDTVGYVTPIIVDEDHTILAGHGRYFVMKDMSEYQTIEVMVLSGLTKLEKDKFRLFDNQTSRTGHYDNELLIDTVRGILGEDSNFNISALAIDGLVDAFSTTEFTFDLGIEKLTERKETKKVIVVVTDDLEGVMELLNSNSIEYTVGHEVSR